MSLLETQTRHFHIPQAATHACPPTHTCLCIETLSYVLLAQTQLVITRAAHSTSTVLRGTLATERKRPNPSFECTQPQVSPCSTGLR
jgi:hypothetical protein